VRQVAHIRSILHRGQGHGASPADSQRSPQLHGLPTRRGRLPHSAIHKGRRYAKDGTHILDTNVTDADREPAPGVFRDHRSEQRVAGHHAPRRFCPHPSHAARDVAHVLLPLGEGFSAITLIEGATPPHASSLASPGEAMRCAISLRTPWATTPPRRSEQ
jgi:hypothetical protein